MVDDDVIGIEKSGDTVYLQIGAWYDKTTGHIHLNFPGRDWSATTVTNQPSSVRCHESLYSNLVKVLRAAGKPAPATADLPV